MAGEVLVIFAVGIFPFACHGPAAVSPSGGLRFASLEVGMT